ncbi:hypothetical protein ACIBF1_08540 [Spirillospora sp. NPDC050679]
MAAPTAHRAHASDRWFYPEDFRNDLSRTDLPAATVAETLACGWEYTRCVVPQFTNQERYRALVRLVNIGIIAEFRGTMVDVVAGDRAVGYDIEELLDTVFRKSPGRQDMGREYRSFLLVTAEKASRRHDSELFRRYVDSLARSPEDWFRLRDCDALARFFIAAALACNDADDVWFSEEEFQLLTELGDALYDAVAYYKHRAEGETNNTFAYAGGDLRLECYRRYREVLWALDTAWADDAARRSTVNFLRYFGGPIHMMMRRYRFVEDGLVIGAPETDQVVDQTRRNFKLWYRVDADQTGLRDRQYDAVLAQRDRLLFPGFAEILERSQTDRCGRCRHRSSYGAQAAEQFGGVRLCDQCRDGWAEHLRSFPARAARVFSLPHPLLGHPGTG